MGEPFASAHASWEWRKPFVRKRSGAPNSCSRPFENVLRTIHEARTACVGVLGALLLAYAVINWDDASDRVPWCWLQRAGRWFVRADQTGGLLPHLRHGGAQTGQGGMTLVAQASTDLAFWWRRSLAADALPSSRLTRLLAVLLQQHRARPRWCSHRRRSSSHPARSLSFFPCQRREDAAGLHRTADVRVCWA